MLGPNGAGKTTLLRALAGLTAVSDGSIRLGDLVLDDAATGTFVPAEQRPVGLVFQNYRLFPHLSVRDNVAFSARSRGDPPPARPPVRRPLPRSSSTSPPSPPTSPTSSPAGRPSGSRWPAHSPPTPGCCCSTSRWRRSTPGPGSTYAPSCAATWPTSPGRCLIVTHDPLEAMVMTDRLLVIEDGRVVQHGTPAAGRPAARDPVRRPPGRPQPVPRDARPSADGTVRLAAGGTLTAAPGAPLPAVGADVLVAVRPSAIAAAHRAPGARQPTQRLGRDHRRPRAARRPGPRPGRRQPRRPRRPHPRRRRRPRPPAGSAGVAVGEGDRGRRVPRAATAR